MQLISNDLKIENDKMFNDMKERNEKFEKKCLEFEENVEKYNYSKGKIYKLTVEGHEKFYIGSTIKTLKQRLSVHNNHFVNPKANYTTAFILFKYGELLSLAIIDRRPHKRLLTG